MSVLADLAYWQETTIRLVVGLLGSSTSSSWDTGLSFPIQNDEFHAKQTWPYGSRTVWFPATFS